MAKQNRVACKTFYIYFPYIEKSCQIVAVHMQWEIQSVFDSVEPLWAHKKSAQKN